MCNNTEIPTADVDVELTSEMLEELTNGKGKEATKE